MVLTKDSLSLPILKRRNKIPYVSPIVNVGLLLVYNKNDICTIKLQNWLKSNSEILSLNKLRIISLTSSKSNFDLLIPLSLNILINLTFVIVWVTSFE